LSVALGVAAALALALLLVHRRVQGQPSGGAASPAGRTISCLGRIQPEDGIVCLGEPWMQSAPSAVVAELSVKEGDTVQKGQVIAVLDSRPLLEAAADAAAHRVELAGRRVLQVRSGAKGGELAAQRAQIAKLVSEVRFAEDEYQRFEQLARSGAVPKAQLDMKRVELEGARQMHRHSEEKLGSLSEVRAVDVKASIAELEIARADYDRARLELAHASVHSPIDGKVIRLVRHPGEKASAGCIAELAKLDPMFVLAEVNESDAEAVKVGQRATMTADAFSGVFEGAVEFIRPQIGRQAVFSSDPSSFADGRVMEVRIRLKDAAKAARYLNARVVVKIQP
jgi:HlyD family secretion protein